MTTPMDSRLWDPLFAEARTHHHWRSEPVGDDTLRALYDMLKWGPTAANSCPARFVFVKSAEAKARLRDCLSAGNVAQTMAAPVTVIVAMDMAFYEQLPWLYPQSNARSWYEGKPEAIEETAFRNSCLQGGYLIMAARALGLDCGPMSGFDRQKLDQAFLAGTTWRSNFLLNLGYGDASQLGPRNPRLDFDQACRMA